MRRSIEDGATMPSGTLETRPSGVASASSGPTGFSLNPDSAQARCKNATIYSSPFGPEMPPLIFTRYCNTERGAEWGSRDINDVIAQRSGAFEDCIDSCAISSAGCQGVTFEGQFGRGLCWHKRISDHWDTGVFHIEVFRSLDMNWHEKRMTAIIVASQLADMLSTAQARCPKRNLAHMRAGAADFTILCGANLVGGDIIDSRTDKALMLRTNSMAECLSICATMRPLCQAVSYVGGGLTPWRNCHLKNGTHLSPGPVDIEALYHSALLTWPRITPYACQPDRHIQATDGRTFRPSCNDHRDAGRGLRPSNLTSFHASDINSCLAQCTANKDSCIGVSFDQGLVQSGILNCDILDSIPETSSWNTNHTLLYVDTLHATIVPPNPPTSKNGFVHIGLPVIGSVIGALIIAMGVVYWRCYDRQSKFWEWGWRSGKYKRV